MLHVPGMPEGVHVSFSPEHLPVSSPAQPERYTPTALVGAGTPSKELTALLDAHELAYGHTLCSEAYGLPDVAERRQAEEVAFRALLHTPMQSDADRVAYAIAVISRQMHSLGDASATERDHPMAVAYRNLRFGEHAREPEEMRHVGRNAKPEVSADPILAAIEAHRAAHAVWEPLMLAWNEVLGGTPEYEAAEAAEAPARQAERDAFQAVLNTRPTTPAGMSALADYLPGAIRQADPDTDAPALAALDALRDGVLCITLALPTEQPPGDAQALAMLDAIEREWALQMAQHHEERDDLSREADRREDVRVDRKRKLLEAAAALPGNSRETRHAKALALSWSVECDLWRSDRTRDQFGADGRLLFDLRSSLAGQVPCLPGTAATAANPLAPNLGLSSYSIPQLCALFDVYDRAEDQFYTAAWWPKLDEAGSELVTTEGDRCMALKNAVANELQKRQPGSESDADERAEKLMRRAVMTGDWESIARLACSLRNEVAACQGTH